MTAPLWVNEDGDGTPAYDATMLRQAMGLVLMYGGQALDARDGVRPGGTQLAVNLNGSVITVSPGLAAFTPRLTITQGVYWGVLPEAETHTLTPADATNPRKDIVIARLYDHDMDASGLKLVRSEYLAGLAGPTPAEPDVPAGAQLLASIDVPRLGGGLPAVTDRRHYTVASGGVLPIPAGQNPPEASAYDGQVIHRQGRLDVRNAGQWVTAADPAAFTPAVQYTPTWFSTGTQPQLGNGSVLARYKRIGQIVHFALRLTFGSTTNGGTGGWQFGGSPSILNRLLANTTLPASAFDSSAGLVYPAMASLTSSGSGGTDVLRIGAHSAAGAIGNVSATHPFTWANGDVLFIHGTFEAAV